MLVILAGNRAGGDQLLVPLQIALRLLRVGGGGVGVGGGGFIAGVQGLQVRVGLFRGHLRAAFLRAGHVERGFALGHDRGRIRRIDFKQGVALFDQLVIAHVHCGHAAGDLRRHRDDMRVDEGIVRRLMGEGMKHDLRSVKNPEQDDDGQSHDDPGPLEQCAFLLGRLGARAIQRRLRQMRF